MALQAGVSSSKILILVGAGFVFLSLFLCFLICYCDDRRIPWPISVNFLYSAVGYLQFEKS